MPRIYISAPDYKEVLVERVLKTGALVALLAAAAVLYLLLAAGGAASRSAPALPVPQPLFTDATQLTTSTTPPTQAQCFSAHRRCFTPQGIAAAYDLGPLWDHGLNGSGETIAIVDSFGSDTIANDLHVFDQAYNLQPMCGEADVTCAPGMPTFSQLALQGSPATKASNNGKSVGQENRTAWSLEVSLDVERAHAVAPGANILLVTTPTAETLGVQGFPQMMAAEDYVVQHHLANVITQSFGAAEQSFQNANSLQNLRYAFADAAANGVTVLASAGDGGTANTLKAPVSKSGTLIPFPSVIWPASDPLVTSVGGTDLCTDPFATTSPAAVDTTDPPARCQPPVNSTGQRELVWQQATAATGGGFSSVFAAPAYQASLSGYQASLSDGSTLVSGMRGVPDVALNGAPATGVLIYDSLPPDGSSGLRCPGPTPGTTVPCSAGWYDIGGTSASSPQWAGIVAIADQANNHVGLGQINPALYKVASNPAEYAADFFDVIAGNNANPSTPVAGFNATPGWDPATGLGTPDAAKLVPDLIAASK